MSFQQNIKRYIFDISKKNIKDRFENFAKDKWAIKSATKLIDIAYREVKESRGPLAPVIKGITTGLLKHRGTGSLGYVEEMEMWSNYMGRDKGVVILGNLSYELSQASSWLLNIPKRMKSSIGLCSSVSFYRPTIGMVHARNMDWPMDGIRNATVLIDYVNGPCGDFTAVSVPGMVGVLSGVAKGRFSATVNLAPSENYSPTIINGWSILLLLRYVFENCQTYEEAVEELSAATTIAPAFVQVVGIKKGQACIIEVFPKGQNGIYEYDGTPLAITNHYLDSNHVDEEWDQDGVIYCTDSVARLDLIKLNAAKCEAKSLKGCLSVLRTYPVMEDWTQQSMVMCAKTGEVLLNDLS